MRTKLNLPMKSAPLARSLRGSLGLALCLSTLAVPAGAQMPEADVIDVEAIGAGLCVSNLFQSNMVIQRDKPIALWGWAAPGEEVTVQFGGERRTVTAAADRRWRAGLPAMPASATPRPMTIRSEDAILTLVNILVGDVWVLGGQSNMEFELAKVENGELEIATAHYDQIRILTVPYGEGPETHESFARLHEWSDWFSRHFRKGDWDVCSPAIARELSAIGYVFARRVHMASGVPIGVIDASRGGTALEAWVPLKLLQSMDSASVQAELSKWKTKVADWKPEEDPEKKAKPEPTTDMNHPGGSYAGMMGPLVGLPVKGVIFHHGYNNTLDGMSGVRLYRDVFPEMIGAWRKAFGDPDMPFGILSLCTDGYPQTRDDYLEKMLNAGMHIRAVQYETFSNLREGGDKNVGFASTYDLRRRWYHPQLKLPGGERIARWALSTQYGLGRTLRWEPPKLLGMDVLEGALLLKLNATVGDPMDGVIEGFAIAGADRRFQPADVAYVQVGEDNRGRPRFDKKQLRLTSPLVSEPIHFRYAWGRNPLANVQLTGHKDLPLATQRSDDWDMGTVPLGVLDEKVDGKLTRAQRNKVLKALRAEDVRRKLAEARALLDD